MTGNQHLPPPAGFVSFCIRFPGQCDAKGETEIVLTEDRWRMLERVNAAVNRALWPEDDQAHYGRPEYWTVPTDGYGDCDDFALTKRRDLINAGFPQRALRIAIVESPRSGRHAVLIVVTDHGAFVLDNLTKDILEQHQTGYAWIEQQDGNNPLAWVGGSFRGPGDRPHPPTGSVGPWDRPAR